MVEKQSKLLPPSEWLKKYYTEDLKAISKGAFGEVYSFIDPKDLAEKALKVIKKTPNDGKEWMHESAQEIKILKRLNNCPYSVRLIEDHVDVENDRILLVMELAAQSLYDYIEIDKKNKIVKKPLSDEELQKLINCLSGGLEYALDLNINHRDIKPENIMIMKDGTFKIADWGAGPFFEKAGTRTATSAIGTKGFEAPEVIEFGLQLSDETLDKEQMNKLNWEKADIYSCGVLIMEACGIYRDQLESIRVKQGLEKLEEGMNRLLNDKLANGSKSYIIPTIQSMCKLSPQKRWGIKELKKLVNEMIEKEKLERKKKENEIRNPKENEYELIEVNKKNI